jgi:hypothetical protein
MNFNADNVRALLNRFEFTKLFIEELGWDRHNVALPISIGEAMFGLRAIAEKRGMVVWEGAVRMRGFVRLLSR